MLLEKIIDLATSTDKELSVLLRLCVVLGHELKNDSLKNWANDELNGYSEVEKLPEYRIVRASAEGMFSSGYLFPNVRRPIPLTSMENDHRRVVETVFLVEPVSAYENALRSHSSRNALTYFWPADIVAHYQETFIAEHALVKVARRPIQRNRGRARYDRTRVLDVALDIKREIGESDFDLKQIERNLEKADKVNHIVINHIYGGTVNVGHQQTISIQTISIQNISIGNWEELTKTLSAVGIQEHEIGELSRAIDQDW
jgi:hypothetical protein